MTDRDHLRRLIEGQCMTSHCPWCEVPMLKADVVHAPGCPWVAAKEWVAEQDRQQAEIDNSIQAQIRWANKPIVDWLTTHSSRKEWVESEDSRVGQFPGLHHAVLPADVTPARTIEIAYIDSLYVPYEPLPNNERRYMGCGFPTEWDARQAATLMAAGGHCADGIPVSIATGIYEGPRPVRP
jgi:hypothetical protein